MKVCFTRVIKSYVTTFKLGYNDHECNEVTAIAKKCYLQVTFMDI
jgi:hypothetical protein